MERTLDEISNLIAEREKEYRACVKAHRTIVQQKLDLDRQVTEIDLKKNALRQALSESATNKEVLKSTLRTLREEYWKIKNG